MSINRNYKSQRRSWNYWVLKLPGITKADLCYKNLPKFRILLITKVSFSDSASLSTQRSQRMLLSAVTFFCFLFQSGLTSWRHHEITLTKLIPHDFTTQINISLSCHVSLTSWLINSQLQLQLQPHWLVTSALDEWWKRLATIASSNGHTYCKS